MRAYTTTFLLTLIILLLTTFTSAYAFPRAVDRRFDLAPRNSPQALAEGLGNLAKRAKKVYPRKSKGSSGGSSGGDDTSDGVVIRGSKGLGVVVAGAAAVVLAGVM